MPIRRHTDPLNLIRIWDAIRHATQQHVGADFPKILRYFQNINVSINAQDVELYIKQAIKDKFILLNKKHDNGSNSYKITQQTAELDGKDWYCFECHLAGEVIECERCARVFHLNCLAGARRKFESQKNANPKLHDNNDVIICDENLQFDEKLCSICNVAKVDYDCNLDKNEINYMLRFVLNRIRSWLPEVITHVMADEERPTWLNDAELDWRANQLFYTPMDMTCIEVKLNTESYVSFWEFLGDVYTIQHNVGIFHGTESQEYGAAELMVRDTVHDLAEMKCCVDCYKHSNEKVNNKWFCLPCRQPHALVWAKQKGYPYWPAKVIKETATHYDVRFFGGKYERALLIKNYIKPISTPIDSLQIKTSSAFNKAYEELKYHQLLLENPIELEKLLAHSKPKRRLQKQKNSLTPKNTPNKPSIMQKLKRKSTDGTANCFDDGKKKKQHNESSSSELITGNVINISDGEDEQEPDYFAGNDISQSFSSEETYEQVTSSTENDHQKRISPMMSPDNPHPDPVEKMKHQLEFLSNKKDIIKCATECLQQEINRLTNEHNEHLKRLFESHNQQISETKKKQWCYNCEQDAIYHCCWNTAYCSQTCQQQHWQAEHKKVCRRKRN